MFQHEENNNNNNNNNNDNDDDDDDISITVTLMPSFLFQVLFSHPKLKTEKALLGLPVVCIHHGCSATTMSLLYSNTGDDDLRTVQEYFQPKIGKKYKYLV